MATWRLTNGGVDARIDSSLVIPWDHENSFKLLKYLSIIHAAVPLTEFRTQPTVANTYDYKLTALDGRIWRQTLYVDGSTLDPPMTFNVTSQWKLSEFTLHRDIRDCVITMIIEFAPSLIKVTF